MSTSNQASSASASNFTAIFQAAHDEYKRLTGHDLDTHPFAAELDSCDSPDGILNVLQKQAQACSRSRKGNKKLLAWLNPTVHVLFTFSASLGEGIGLPFSPAKTIFTGIGVLLGAVKDVVRNYDTLISLFERIHLFLKRLDSYTSIPLTTTMTELLGKIMAQVLSILALSTKTIKERRIKTFLKKLGGRTDLEDALLQLDSLTREENLMTATRNLEVAHHVDSNVVEVKELTHDVRKRVEEIEEVTRGVDDNVKDTKQAIDQLKQNHSREKLRSWLSPPSPSINHNVACDAQHDGTATWLVQGRIFEEWKTNGSLLWIRGNPGSGKSVLCSAIIEDVKHMRQTKPALIAYYYFDFKDVAKRDIRGLLSSLLTQLGDDSEQCWSVLSQLYSSYRDGSEQPSEAALTQCLKSMLDLPGQIPIYIIVDALDECPNNIGTPSARKRTLVFVKDLIGWKHPNLRMCITSRPEQDIQATLTPLTSISRRVSIHEEGGQREDIKNYIRSFVLTDESMRRWRAEDKELVINTLSERAEGMFRWVYCQLDTLCRCFPPSIRKVLNELPITLDETYERTLQGIPREKKDHSRRLFQCLVAAARPLRVEELAEIFTIEFDANATPNMVEGWRPESPEEAVLSACSTLVAIVDDGANRIVQFSHFSVKEFLTSDRLRISDIGTISHYYVPLEPAHTTLARACLTVLLQLDETVDKERLATFPLVFYSAQHWVKHAKFENVTSQIQDFLECLFDPTRSHFAAWTRIYNIDPRMERPIDDLAGHSASLTRTPLYYAALYGFFGLAKHLVTMHAEDVNAKCGMGSPLHAASYGGHLDIAHFLLDLRADPNATNESTRTPLCAAYDGGHFEVMRLLLEHGAIADAWHNIDQRLLHRVSHDGKLEFTRLLLQHNANVNIRSANSSTPLHMATLWKQQLPQTVEILLEYQADVNALNQYSDTPLFLASWCGNLENVKVLLEHGADIHIRGERNWTPFQAARENGHDEIARLLLEHGSKRD